LSKRSESVKKWRRKTKEKLVLAMGGKCNICGYNKCNAALSFHHLDPFQKDFEISSISSPKKLEYLIEEVKKCILVCNNCHAEIHAGMTKIINTTKFDQSIIDNFDLNDNDFCPICGAKKKRENKYCSINCAAKNRYKIEWDKFDLEEELKTKSIFQLSKEIGCSDKAIHKRLKKLGLR
jgi:rubrerythrin